MKTAIQPKHSALVAGAAAALALAAMGFAGAAQARDNVYWSVGVGSPGVAVNVGNAFPVYSQPAPVYVQALPVYVQAQPVFVQPRPYYYGQPQVVYMSPGRHNGWYGQHGREHEERHEHHGGDRDDHDGRGYQQGYAPVYYRR